jgi:hypothetical protein
MSSRQTRNFLLGIAVSTLPLAGCDLPPADPAQQAAYEQALESQSPRQVSRFLTTYPDSRQVRSLLISMPPAVLMRIPATAVDAVDDAIIASLPPETRRLLSQTVVPAQSAPPVRRYTG